MDPPSTPRQAALELPSSSVFMTPPLSSQKPGAPPADAHSNPPRPSKLLPLSLLSPALTPPAAGRSRVVMTSPDEVDILSELYLRGHLLVMDFILSLLSPADLSSSLQVSSTWNKIITSDTRLVELVAGFRRQRKENAENLQKLYIPLTVTSAERRALSTIATNVPTQVPKSVLVQNTRHLPPQGKFLPCPNCQSSARQLNQRRAECAQCSFDYCLHCFKPWHAGDCVKRTLERAGDSIAGTKKSKKRLRRL